MSTSETKKKINKIYDKLDKLAVKGKDSICDYHKYIDELIAKGDYNYLELTLFYFYFIDISTIEYATIVDVKNKTWDKILFQTNSTLAKKIKKVFDDRGIYQLGYEVYNDTTGERVGKIVEIDYLSPANDPVTKYYFENKEYSKLIGLRRTYLEVTKVGATSSIFATSSVIIDETSQNTTEDNNLINRYKLATNYLLS